MNLSYGDSRATHQHQQTQLLLLKQLQQLVGLAWVAMRLRGHLPPTAWLTPQTTAAAAASAGVMFQTVITPARAAAAVAAQHNRSSLAAAAAGAGAGAAAALWPAHHMAAVGAARCQEQWQRRVLLLRLLLMMQGPSPRCQPTAWLKALQTAPAAAQVAGDGVGPALQQVLLLLLLVTLQ